MRSMCRAYPRLITAQELVGRASLLLSHVSGLSERAQLLVENLAQEELARLSQAVHQVLDELDRDGTDAFRLGAVVSDQEKSHARVVLDDRVVPREFVEEVKRAIEKTKSVGSSAAG